MWLGASAINITSLLLPPGPVRIGMAMPALLYCLYSTRSHTSGKPAEDYIMAVNVSMTLLKFIDFVVLRTPEKCVYHVKDGRPVEASRNPENMNLWQKLKWSLSLFTTYRGLGWIENWNWKVRNVDEVPEDTPKWYAWL